MLVFQVILGLQILLWMYRVCVIKKARDNLDLYRQTWQPFPNGTARPKLKNNFFVI